MRLQPDPDALEFASAVRDLLARSADSAALRAAWDSTDGRVPGLWKRLGELGVPGLTVPEPYGGAGADLTAALPVLVETGRAAAPEPVLETLVGTALLAGATGGAADEWLPQVAAGTAALAVGPGPSGLVAAAPWADLLLLHDAAGDAVHALARDAVEVVDAPAVDKGVRLARVVWSPSPGSRLVGADWSVALDLAATAAAAQLLGAGEAMLDMAVRYAGQREQFGRPIGSFQAVKHALADAYVALAFARPVVARAAWSVSRGLSTRARDASHAKCAAGAAAQQVARTALQVHGGIGYTFEHDLHMWLKRTWTLSSLWGTGTWHRSRVAAAVLPPTAAAARVP